MLSKYSQNIITEYKSQGIIQKININYKTSIHIIYNKLLELYNLYNIVTPTIQSNINILEINNNRYIHDLNKGISKNQNDNILFFINDIKKSKWIPSNISNSLHVYNKVSIFKYKYINIYLYKKTQLSNNDIALINECILRIFIIKELYNDRQLIKIGIFDTPYTKKISKNINRNIAIGPNNVNGGLCYFNYNIIILWRKEELKKVIIHELLHSLKVDKELIVNDHIFKSYMKNSFKLNKHFGVNESYTETLACIYNIILTVILDKLIITSNHLKTIYNYLEIEIFYALVKTSQILNYYKFTSIKDLLIHSDKRINQESNVFSYYILKCFILYNFNDVFKTLYDNKCITHYNMKLNTNCSNIYFNIIKYIFDHNKKSFNKLNTIIGTIIKNKYFINNSLRMTAIE